jgi:hypothetical protein
MAFSPSVFRAGPQRFTADGTQGQEIKTAHSLLAVRGDDPA